jgi:hypothetical protein
MLLSFLLLDPFPPSATLAMGVLRILSFKRQFHEKPTLVINRALAAWFSGF